MTAPRYILVVDDEADVELLISQRFRRQVRSGEFAFSFARDGEQALRVLESDGRIELILLDINMPVMNGEEFLTQVASRGDLKAVPVVVVSTDSTGMRVDRMMSLGAKGYVKKPFSPESLREELERVLEVPHGGNG